MSDAGVRVLIAEDEILIAAMIEEALTDEGLATTIAHSGGEAVVALDAVANRFQVLVTDIRVGAPPDGWALARRARETDPGLGVIYITGDSMEGWRANGVPESVLIAKPFVPAQIVAAVMALLNKARTQQAGMTTVGAARP